MDTFLVETNEIVSQHKLMTSLIVHGSFEPK